ncbi:hypothetical protein HYC85_014048 [Camellia sinensis]|uniref:FAD/NAD(P)-binding domain-containing protein n=1 Tax=Camellia sinensis TaxID=4442 RepID=A0A7J7H768_CAMSI|nr:hypothetical protein HYC85_014048 [Camellia sinensis]
MAAMGGGGSAGGGEKKTVVVVGGGVAGSLLARHLQDHANVVLMDSKEYFELPWASLRSMVEPLFAERSLINHSEYLPNARVVVSTAIDITESEVLTEKGDLITYDYLVIATGHVDIGALARNDKLCFYQAELRSSVSMKQLEGGPTGVELAGEIAVDFPDKKVTLVHRGSRLLEFIGPKAGKKAMDWLISKKVEVILGQFINNELDGVYETSSGETIKTDCYYDCTGKPMGSSLMVDANLRVKGHKNIFGIGDITDIPEIKQGYLAQRHAMVAAKNLKLLMTGGEESGMATYRAAWPLAFVSLGRNDAVAQILFITMIGYIPGMIKSRDLFVGKTRKQLGLTSDLPLGLEGDR